jgi:cytoskeletal protein CcmA (bactofilin family)
VLNSPTSTAQSNLPKPGPGPARSGLTGLASSRTDISSTETANGVSVIGNDLTILGEKITIISKNKLQVDGHVRGDVHGKQVTISKGGSVTGQVCAERIEVRGGVRGAIRAITVTLYDSAKVDGDIMHQKLSIAEGAEFDGNVRRVDDPNALMPVLDAEAIAGSSSKDHAGFGANDD